MGGESDPAQPAAVADSCTDGCCAAETGIASAGGVLSADRRGVLTRRVRLLVAATITYNVAEAIVAFAARVNADVVLLGTHGRTGMSRMLIGSVAEDVVRTAGCSVFIVRTKAHDRPRK
jgi:hypothetical protein